MVRRNLSQLILSTCLLLLACCWCSSVQASDTVFKEPKTGIAFPAKLKKESLVKLGVRTKGPIKVYAVGLYGEGTFLLQMARSVSATKMSSALSDALHPRCKACAVNDVADFAQLLTKGLPSGASQGTLLLFETSRGKLVVSVNHKKVGTISSKALAKAFANIYTDKNAVCQLKSVDGGVAEEEDDHFLIGVLVSLGLVVGATAFLFKGTKKIRVCDIHVYPIKSCAAQTLHSATPTVRGFQGDRIAQVTDRRMKYCTPRDADKAKLFHVLPTLQGTQLTVACHEMTRTLELDIASAPTKKVMATVLECPEKIELNDYGNEAAKWMEEATSIPGCRLTGIGTDFDRTVHINDSQGEQVPTADPAPVSLADEAPYLLTSTSSLQDLNCKLEARGKDPVDMRRFRPNIVVSGVTAWEEDSWRKIRIHGVEFHVWQRCGRCTMTTIDRDTLARGPEPLATLSTFRERDHGQRNFGMHLIPVSSTLVDGVVISKGDVVEVLEVDEERRKEWKELHG